MRNDRRKHRYGQRGTITVFLTILLVPTILLTTILADLTRIKFYRDQALMTADNYGEAILTEYDNLLKELYGLFAVSQDEKGQKAIKTLEGYMKTSFNPNTNTVNFEHLKDTVFNNETAYHGFMPYSLADLELGYEPCADANLQNNAVLSTQIGDFMRYRIVQSLNKDGGKIFAALEKLDSQEADSEVMGKKQDLDESAEDILEIQKEYYEQLEKMNSYVELYLKDLNKAYQNAKKLLNGDSHRKGNAGIAGSQRYKDYIEEALKEDGDAEYLREEGKYFQDEIDAAIKPFSEIYNNGKRHDKYSVTFSNYEQETLKLKNKADDLIKKMREFEEKRTALEVSLKDTKVSEDIKNNVQEELDNNYKTLMDSDIASNCLKIAEMFNSGENRELNKMFNSHTGNIKDSPDDGKINSLQEVRDFYLRFFLEKADEYPKDADVEYITDIEISRFKDFKAVAEFKKTYDLLKSTFNNDSDSEVEKQTKEKKDKANRIADDKKNKLANQDKEEDKQDEKKENDEKTVRDIPSSIAGIGDGGKAKALPKFKKMASSISSLLKAGSLEGAKNELLLKFYEVNYDFGMFSDRITDIKNEEAKQESGEEGNEENNIKTSLTGYEICKDINYLCGAELEYLYGGHKKSKENLREVRNTILQFRFLMNLAATYSVKEVNAAIREITAVCSAINPILGLAAVIALRTGAAAIETFADWELLTKGKSVTFVKKKISDLSARDEMEDLLGKMKGDPSDSGEMKLDYEQYLALLLIVLTPRDDITERTGDLICLNVNNVRQGSDFKDLTFKMNEAVTAVRSYCKVHLDFLVIPEGLLQGTLDADTADSIESFENNYYKYSVVRGY